MTGLTVWFTGLSGSGKSTLCQAVYEELVDEIGIPSQILDADEVRKHLCRGLGFSKEDRDENIRRIGYVAKLLTRNNILALVAAISPYREIRNEVRSAIGNFLEVYVHAPLAVCEERDPKGLYKKARAGEIRGFTGIDDPYEPPVAAEVECRTDRESVRECTLKVVSAILHFLNPSADVGAGDSDGHATASTRGSRHVPVSKPSRAAAGGASACVGH